LNFKNVKLTNTNDELCHFSEEEINFLTCTFLRKQGDFKKAANIYKSLQPLLDKNESEEFRTILMSGIVLLLNYDRKIMLDSFNEIKTYFDLINDDNAIRPVDDDMLLSTYSIKYEKVMVHLRSKTNKN